MASINSFLPERFGSCRRTVDQGAEGAWAQAAISFRDAARLTADPVMRDEYLARSSDALVAAGDCVAAAASVPAVESLRETPLRNAALVPQRHVLHSLIRCRDEELVLDLLNGLPLRYGSARVDSAFGQTLRRAGKRRQADRVISTAREIYLSLGAQTYVARCDGELKTGGLHQVRGSRDNVQLTPQEEAVSTLVARGLSNREVAALRR